MKKNVMMRVASVLLICVLLTSSVISGTFAKYVTTDAGSDTAQVAKWGVVVKANPASLFAQGYKDGSYDATADVDAASVWSKADLDLVAPGTQGELADFTVTGTPEVDVEVTYTAELTLTGWFLDADKDGVQDPGEDEYCPLVFTVNGETYGTTVTSATNKYASVAELITAVQNAIVDSDEVYQHNTNLGDNVYGDLAVSWKWEFVTGDAATNDPKDTTLGDAAAAGYPAKVTLNVSCTVTQVD